MWACSRLRLRVSCSSPLFAVSARVTARYPPHYRVAHMDMRRELHVSGIRRCQEDVQAPETVPELLEKGANLVVEENWEGARTILENALERDDKSDTLVSAYISMHLGFTYHQQGELDKAREHYQLYLTAYDSHSWKERAQTHDYASTLVNFAELLASQKHITEALIIVRKGIRLLRTMDQKLFLAAALSNLSSYLCAQKKYEEAQKPCTEAMNIFIHELGRFSDHTRTTFVTMYEILQSLGKTDELADLEADWDTIDPKEVGNFKGYHPDDVELLEREVARKEVVQKVELPDLNEIKKFQDAAESGKMPPESAPRPPQPKSESKAKEVRFEDLNELDPFFGIPKKKTIGFDPEVYESEKLTPEFLRNELPSVQALASRHERPRTNEWRFFRTNEKTFSETLESENFLSTPNFSAFKTVAEGQEKEGKGDGRKEELSRVTVDKSGTLSSSEVEWQRREAEVKELLKKTKGRKKASKTEDKL